MNLKLFARCMVFLGLSLHLCVLISAEVAGVSEVNEEANGVTDLKMIARRDLTDASEAANESSAESASSVNPIEASDSGDSATTTSSGATTKTTKKTHKKSGKHKKKHHSKKKTGIFGK